MEVIRQHAFDGCKRLVSVSVPGSVRKIAKYTFYGCVALKSVEIPVGVTEIRKHSFEGCSSLKSVRLTVGTEKIMRHAFDGCKKLESVYIPEGLKYLDISAFLNCPLLKRIFVPRSVTVMTEEDDFEWENFTAEILYGGDRDDWNKIRFEAHRMSMYTHVTKSEFSKRLRFYSEEKPCAKGRYWHYSESGDAENW